jgi:hypothetical protein
MNSLSQKFLQLFPVILFFTLAPSFALVDYTEQEDFTPQKSGASSVSKKAPVSRSVTKPKRSSSAGEGLNLGINMGVSYGTQDVELNGQSGKVDTMAIEAHLQTRYNIFLALSHYQAKSSDSGLVEDSTSFQQGNSEIMLGFNWLQFGKSSELVTVDLYGGVSLGRANSDFATERTDRVVGVSTAKRFYNFALGLGYEYRMTGNGAADEMAIGNIGKLQASLGWVVSSDIRFLIEGSTYSMASSDDPGASIRLEEDLDFSTITPQLQLKLSPLVDMTLGARFRTRRIKSAQLTAARLWSLEGAYGNSVFAGLSVNI